MQSLDHQINGPKFAVVNENKLNEQLVTKGCFMLIYEALKKDHEKVKSLLNELLMLDVEADGREDLINQIRDELIPHSRAEEAVFYNSLREIDAAKDIVMHGYQEHIMAETLLRTLQTKEMVNADWKATAQKLKDALEHHIAEEEGKIFNVAKELISEEEAMRFGEAFEAMKPEIKEEGFMGTTVDLIKNLMPPRFTKSFHVEASNPK